MKFSKRTTKYRDFGKFDKDYIPFFKYGMKKSWRNMRPGYIQLNSRPFDTYDKEIEDFNDSEIESLKKDILFKIEEQFHNRLKNCDVLSKIEYDKLGEDYIEFWGFKLYKDNHKKINYDSSILPLNKKYCVKINSFNYSLGRFYRTPFYEVPCILFNSKEKHYQFDTRLELAFDFSKVEAYTVKG